MTPYRLFTDKTEPVHFFSLEVPQLLQQALRRTPEGFSVVDLGCGDGNMVFTLKHHGLLSRSGRVVGVDQSPVRVQQFKAHTSYEGIVANATNVDKIERDSTDLVLCTMVIEHVPDDAALLHEAWRILKPGGALYITSVFKKAGAWYFRRSPDNRWVLDPTHVREYSSPSEFTSRIREARFSILQTEVLRLCPPLLHPIFRILNSIFPIPGINKLFLSGGLMRRLEQIRIPIPRYREIQVLARKPDEEGRRHSVAQHSISQPHDLRRIVRHVAHPGNAWVLARQNSPRSPGTCSCATQG
jgi:ubiquinone/menaquinone biosynthesis C-methylase UbiE